MYRSIALPVCLVTVALSWGVQAREEDPATDAEPFPFVEGAFTIAVMPDTQGYAEDFPELFEAQTVWIAENAAKRNIAMVLHLGDITDDNIDVQWEVARGAMSKLDGVAAYAMVLGNHDYGLRGFTADRSSGFDACFARTGYRAQPTFGGVFDGEPESMVNSYHLFSAGGRDFVVLALEFGPRDVVLDWANGVLAAHPDRWAIVITHAYLYYDDTRYDWAAKGAEQSWSPRSYKIGKEPGQCNDGEAMWRKLVAKHPRMLFVINGHVLNDGLGLLTSTGESGNPVHQMLVNFQMKAKLGGGYLRLLQFLPDGETVQVQDYSPATNQYKTGPEHVFTLAIPKS